MSEIDLHTHSNASDGTFSPTELVVEAKRSGLKAIALTDHDTTQGLQEAISSGQKHQLEIVPGCELSVEYTAGLMHIVGLWLPSKPLRLREKLEYLRQKRHSRNETIIEKLHSLGINIDYQEVKDLAAGESVGRPHIAQILVKNNYVQDLNQAFTDYIGSNGAAYVPKEKFTPPQAIDILKQEGATVVLAHPYTLQLSLKDLRQELRKLIDLGLDGMEVYYPDHGPELSSEYLALCREMNLLVSGGSDFHGQVKPDIKLGTGRDNLNIPYSLLEKMKEQRRAKGLRLNPEIY